MNKNFAKDVIFLDLHIVYTQESEQATLNDPIAKSQLYYKKFNYQLAYDTLKTALKNEDHLQSSIYEANINNDLGVILDKFGKYQEAQIFFERALELLLKEPQNYMDIIAKVYLALSNICIKLAKYKDAENYLNLCTKFLSENNKDDRALLWNDWGLLSRAISNYEESIEFHEKSIDLYTKLHGKNFLGLALCYENLASSLKLLGRFNESLTYCKRAIDIYQINFKGLHPNVGPVSNLMAFLYGMTGEHIISLQKTEISFKTFQSYFSMDHPELAQTYFTLGMTYFCQQRGEEARKNMLKAQEIYEKNNLENHPEATNLYNTLGLVYASLGQFEEAIQTVLKSQKIVENYFGQNHPKAAGNFNSMGLIYVKLHDHPKAFQNYMRCLRLLIKKFGILHPYIGNALNNITGLLKWNGDSSGSLNLLIKSTIIYKQFYGKEHRFVVRNKQKIIEYDIEETIHSRDDRVIHSGLNSV